MGSSVTENWNTRVTSTAAAWIKQKPIDQYFSGNLLLSILLGQKSPATKKDWPLKANRVLVRGGREVRIPLRYSPSTNITSFTHADTLDLNIDDIHTMCRLKWAYYTDAAVVTWQEDIENRGESELFDIMQERITNAMDTIYNRVDGDLYSTGDGVSVGNGGKNVVGLDHTISSDPTTGTVWGLNRATYSWWRHNLITGGDTFANVGLSKLAEMWTTISGTNGEDPPTLGLTTPAQWRAYHALVANVQQIVTTKVGDRGYPTIEYMGRPIFYSSSIASNVWKWLNMNYMVVCLQQGAQFAVVSEGMQVARQLLKGIWRIVWGGQVGFERYDRQGYMTFTG